MDAESVDGGNVKGEPATMDSVDDNVVLDNADEGEDDSTDIECYQLPLRKGRIFLYRS